MSDHEYPQHEHTVHPVTQVTVTPKSTSITNVRSFCHPIFFCTGSVYKVYLHSQFDLNCTNFTVAQLKTINLARGLTGAISLVMVSLILLFLIFYKAYRSALQRLLVYLTMVTCLHDISFVLQIEHQFEYNGQNKFCAFIGFFDTWTSTVLYLFILQINLFLVYTVHKQL